MIGLGDLPGGRYHSDARAVNADGSVVVGYSFSEKTEAFRWTEENGLEPLFELDKEVSSGAKDISDDGRVVVGWVTRHIDEYLSINDAFRWSQEEGLVRLGALPDWDDSSTAAAVSADGNVVVGEATFNHWPGLFHWDFEHGMPTSRSC